MVSFLSQVILQTNLFKGIHLRMTGLYVSVSDGNIGGLNGCGKEILYVHSITRWTRRWITSYCHTTHPGKL